MNTCSAEIYKTGAIKDAYKIDKVLGEGVLPLLEKE